MAFQVGQSGNPNGRPKGISDKRTELRALLEPHAKDIFEKLVELAKAGDTTALKLCVERLLPKVKPDNGILFQIPYDELDVSSNMVAFAGNLLSVVMRGHLSVDEADRLINFIRNQQSLMSKAKSRMAAEESKKNFVNFLTSEN